jgi:nicotinamide mononucleotide transporter
MDGPGHRVLKQNIRFILPPYMTFPAIWQQFVQDMHQTSWLEYLAVITGILSVWFSRMENIWVYPTGLVSTIIYIFVSYEGGLLGEASVNFYYTVMSVYGWVLWARKNESKQHVLQISSSGRKEWLWQLAFFAGFYLVLFFALTYLKQDLFPYAIPWADAFASATAYTGMWLMAKKKIESWYWWIATNLSSIPLYFVKHYVFTSVYYVVLLVMAIFGLIEWIKRENARQDAM